MKLTKLSLTFIAAYALVSSCSYAADFSVGPSIGSNGLGAYASLAPGWNLGAGSVQIRLSGGTNSRNDSEVTFETKFDNVDYTGELDFSGVQLGLDWYIFPQSQFFISGGLIDFDRQFDVTNKASANIKIGDQNITASDNVILKTEIDYSSTAPYLGLGWGNRHNGESGFSFLFEIGAAFPQDDPDVDFTLTDTNNVISNANLEKHRKNIQDDLSEVQLTATIGIGFHF